MVWAVTKRIRRDISNSLCGKNGRQVKMEFEIVINYYIYNYNFLKKKKKSNEDHISDKS